FTTRVVAGMPPESRIARIAEGTVLIKVTSAGSLTRVSGFSTTCRLPPRLRGTKHSYTARSKFREVDCSVRANTAGSSAARAQWIRLTALRCSIDTLLGSPVDPEV